MPQRVRGLSLGQSLLRHSAYATAAAYVVRLRKALDLRKVRRYGHVHPPQLVFRNVLWLPHTFERMRIAEQMRRTLCVKGCSWLLETLTERYEDGIGSFQERFHRRTVVQVHNVLLT